MQIWPRPSVRRLAENGNTRPLSNLRRISIAPRVIKVCAPRCIWPTPHKTVNTLSTLVLSCAVLIARIREPTLRAHCSWAKTVPVNFSYNSVTPDKHTRFDASNLPCCARIWNNIVFHASPRSELLKLIQGAKINGNKSIECKFPYFFFFVCFGLFKNFCWQF